MKIFLILLFQVSLLSAAELEVHFINVGQGDCTLIQCPNGRNVLIDCGSSGKGDKERVRSYLLAELGSNPTIDVLVITHPDRDHYNFLPHVLAEVKVKKIVLTDDDEKYAQDGTAEWLGEFAASKKVRLGKDHFDEQDAPSGLFGAGETKFRVLASFVTGSTKKKKRNANSIVLMVSLDEFDVLLTGDATKVTEDKIIDRYDDGWLDVEVLKIGHHGSLTTSTSARWAMVTKPEVAVVSCSYSNGFKHPHSEVVKRLIGFTLEEPKGHEFRWAVDPDGDGPLKAVLKDLDGFKEAVYTTARNGDVVVRSDGTAYSVEFSSKIIHKYP